MSVLPDKARAVVIGAGIVGNSMAYHLARLGWRDIVLLEKGMLPNPGGSTGHASNFIFLTDHAKEMAAFTIESARQYRELGVLRRDRRHRGRPDPRADGGAEAPDGVVELVGHRGQPAAHSGRGQGDGPVHRRVGHPRRLLHARRRGRRLAPGRHADAPEGPGDGRADDRRRRRGHRHRRRGRPRPARPHGRRATIETDVVVIACGVWSPRIARMAGASIPLTPAVHQMIDIGPVPMFANATKRGRLPDRPRHGHEHVRAPARQRLRDRLVRPPGDPHGRRRHPVDRGVGPLADDAAVHPGGLRPAARGRPRALPRDRRRRVGRA